MNDELLTVKQLCEWLQITRKTSERWRAKGMPYMKHGKLIRFQKEEVLKWLKENTKM